MWEELEKPWQEAFKLAWEAYKKGTIPIGAVIVNSSGQIVSKGRNMIFDKESNHPLAGTNMAHAEMTALSELTNHEHPDVRNYILYTTLEPCPMCFGASVMMNIRNIYYGGDDGFAGATILKEKFDYIKRKNMNIVKIGGELEIFQLILQTAYEYERNHPRIENILEAWRKVNKKAVEYGKFFHESGYFREAKKTDKIIDVIYNEVINTVKNTRDGTNKKNRP